MEVAECWELALEDRKRPSALALTRQNLEALRTEYSEKNLCALGAYEIAGTDGDAQVTLFASGSEVAIALEARDLLSADNIAARVVSVPSFERFAAQSAAYRSATIGNAPAKVAIEAGVRQGWDSIIGNEGAFVGMSGFGASAPYEQLYKHFGITAEAAAKAARELLAKTS
jgi:transketolase